MSSIMLQQPFTGGFPQLGMGLMAGSAELPDADVQRQVLRALLLDTRVPLTVDARVRDGIVTLTGLVASEWERGHARSSASSVPGVLGIADHLSVLPRSGGSRLGRPAS